MRVGAAHDLRWVLVSAWYRCVGIDELSPVMVSTCCTAQSPSCYMLISCEECEVLLLRTEEAAQCVREVVRERSTNAFR